MTEANESAIGALRTDGIEKPEATVLRNFAKFSSAAGPHLPGRFYLERNLSRERKNFWSPYVVELAEGLEPATELYKFVTAQLKIKPMFESQSALPLSVLVYPMELDDSVLYVFEFENADDAEIDLRDALTGARLTLKLSAQHAAIALIGKQEKSILA